MAKFNNSHLKLKTDQRTYFGDSDESWFSYTTTSGQGTDLTTNVPIAGEQATQSYHLVRYDQLTALSGILSDHGNLTGLGDDDHLQYILVDGSRGFTSTVSGVDPTLSYHLTTKYYVDTLVSTISGGNFDHGNLTGLADDDHTQYILVDGTRAFTGTVSGIDPTEDAHLTTKFYVDSAITTATGSLTTDHGSLTGLTDDDHPQYILVDGSRGFTSTVSGVDPVNSYDLTTKYYVDGEISTLSGVLSGQIITDHGNLSGLGDDDHTQYILVDGTRAFTGTVSGIAPTEDDHLATKFYVDSQLSTISGTKKWGREAVINSAVSQAVTFDSAFIDDSYTLVATLTNEVDSPPSIYSTIQGVKTAGGFTTHFSGEIDSANFILEWFAFYGDQS